jgi:tRNA (guanine37-N1)-methyltransferase
VADSFADGLLDCPQYTRPAVWSGTPVPSVLTSGDHKAITLWRRSAQLARTKDRRPDLIEKLDQKENEVLINNQCN